MNNNPDINFNERCKYCLHHNVCYRFENNSSTCKDYKPESVSALTLAHIAEDAINSFCFHGKDFIEEFRHWHPTLQQSFVREIIAGCLVDLAQRKYFDDRNAASVELARTFVEAAGDYCLPFI